MKIYFVYIFIVLTIFTNCNEKVLNKLEFTEIYLNELSKKSIGDTALFAYSIVVADSIEIQFDDGWITNLTNAYKQYNKRPDEIVDIINTYLDTDIKSRAYRIYKEFSIRNVVPIIKSNWFFYNMWTDSISLYSPFETLEYKIYNDSLVILYAIDRPTGFSLINRDLIDSLSIPRLVLQNVAMENLREIANEYEIFNLENNLYRVYINGFYESNLILLEEIFRREDFDIEGEFIVAIPNREYLYVTGSKEFKAIDSLKKVIQVEYNETNHPICSQLFIWKGEKFDLFLN